ncbi:MAG TPA: hypothetical protein PLL20_20740, partial [Phycisphaerae bacterium]|nr:hypothetical protein [Phycisphaerae bacterium]
SHCDFDVVHPDLGIGHLEPYGQTSVRLARMFLDRQTFGLRPALGRSQTIGQAPKKNTPD